ncbi:MAG: hypothetical protein KKE64_06385, partial [Candidatus Omnitrophica bacterium]|nr:hypothetical protein [Candidatus Omnitrophota bacterium]
YYRDTPGKEVVNPSDGLAKLTVRITKLSKLEGLQKLEDVAQIKNGEGIKRTLNLNLQMALQLAWNKNEPAALARLVADRENMGKLRQEQLRLRNLALRGLTRVFVNFDGSISIFTQHNNIYIPAVYTCLWDAFRSMDHTIDNLIVDYLNLENARVGISEILDQEFNSVKINEFLQNKIGALDKVSREEKILIRDTLDTARKMLEINEEKNVLSLLQGAGKLLVDLQENERRMVRLIEVSKVDKLREILNSRYSKVQNFISQVQMLIRCAEYQKIRRLSEKFKRIRFLSDPEFKGIIKRVIAIQKALSSKKKPDTQSAQKELKLIDKIIKNSRQSGYLVISYRRMLKTEGLRNKKTGVENEVFNNTFQAFVSRRQLIRGSPQYLYWRGRFWMTVNIPYKIGRTNERVKNPLFEAASLILLFLDVENFGKTLKYLSPNKGRSVRTRKLTHELISSLLKKELNIRSFSGLEPGKVWELLERIIDVIAQDFTLTVDEKQKLLAMFGEDYTSGSSPLLDSTLISRPWIKFTGLVRSAYDKKWTIVLSLAILLSLAVSTYIYIDLYRFTFTAKENQELIAQVRILELKYQEKKNEMQIAKLNTEILMLEALLRHIAYIESYRMSEDIKSRLKYDVISKFIEKAQQQNLGNIRNFLAGILIKNRGKKLPLLQDEIIREIYLLIGILGRLNKEPSVYSEKGKFSSSAVGNAIPGFEEHLPKMAIAQMFWSWKNSQGYSALRHIIDVIEAAHSLKEEGFGAVEIYFDGHGERLKRFGLYAIRPGELKNWELASISAIAQELKKSRASAHVLELWHKHLSELQKKFKIDEANFWRTKTALRASTWPRTGLLAAKATAVSAPGGSSSISTIGNRNPKGWSEGVRLDYKKDRAVSLDGVLKVIDELLSGYLVQTLIVEYRGKRYLAKMAAANRSAADILLLEQSFIIP